MLQRQLPDLRVEDLEIRHIWIRRRAAEHISGPRQQLLLPFGDLGGVHAELLCQFCERLVARDGRQRHLGLEGRSVNPSGSLHRLASLVRHHPMALVKPGYHLAHCPNFRGPLCSGE